MNNSIAYRIADFLKQYPPFSFLNANEILRISESVLVKYLEKNQVLFKIGEKTHSVFYVVQSGAIGLTIASDNDEILIDKCDEGDILGLRPFFAKDNYLMHAKAREESIVYAIPIDVFKPYVASNSDVLHFLLQSFASNTRNPLDKNHKGKLLSENVIYDEKTSEIQYFKPIKYTTNPFTAKPNQTVKEIALLMTDKKIGSVIIEKNKKPLGIITDKDLRSKIATGLFDINANASAIMSAPVLTVAENLSIAEAQISMLKNNIGHLCVTADGTDTSEIIGVISEHDIILAQANNPGVLLKEIKRANKTSQLKDIRAKLSDLIEYSLDMKIPIQHLSNIVSEINSAITKRLIDLSIQKMDVPPPCSFAWLSIGSQGRKEQLLVTDQDHALVFEDVEEPHYLETKKYFLNLAELVSKSLHKIGFEFCPANMMASNPQWCKSVTDWKKQYNQWINSPGDNGILMCTIFFDYDCIYGQEYLVTQLTETIFRNVKGNELFFAYLGSDAIKNPPPLGFFRQFLVENDGVHKDTFDIKSRALMPLIDAARILGLSHEIKDITNTYSRYQKLAEIEPQNKDIYHACASAFLELLQFRTEEGIINENSGRFLNLTNLSKLDKVKLKNAFSPIQEVQEILKSRFQLTYFS